MKTYVLMLAKTFPKTHRRAGEPTNFKQLLERTLFSEQNQPGSAATLAGLRKLHTIRENYKLWEKRITEINAGRAVLSVREWTGIPRKSKQKELFRFTGNLGIQKLQLCFLGWFIDDIDSEYITKDFAENDGLSQSDFYHWFSNLAYWSENEPMAIIHFTNFRYQ